VESESLKIFYHLSGIISNAGGRKVKTEPRRIKIEPNICPVSLMPTTFWYNSREFRSSCAIFLQAVLSPHHCTACTSSITLFAISALSGTYPYNDWVIKRTMKPQMKVVRPTAKTCVCTC